MAWFTANAPIRLKLTIAFGSLLGLMFAGQIAALLVGGWFGLIPALGSVGLAGVLALRFHHAISYPYVTTVVRMEALAAGDRASPIAFTDFTDCVGRMTKAMRVFSAAAEKEQQLSAEQDRVVALLRTALASLNDGDLTAEIREEMPPSYLAL